MLINGEKFACEACVRGHRVSSCHHQGKWSCDSRGWQKISGVILTCPDRPLVHVNKKGRPVSQCQHCRGLRKARAQHVKCECHDKAHVKEECPHENPSSAKTGRQCVVTKPCSGTDPSRNKHLLLPTWPALYLFLEKGSRHCPRGHLPPDACERKP